MIISMRILLLFFMATMVSACASPVFDQKDNLAENHIPQGQLESKTKELVEGSTLVYVSDYFSFAGRDEKGPVAFALDTNRGRDGEKYQADHFVALYDKLTGWVDVPGTGVFANERHDLIGLPDSPGFHFKGKPLEGLIIRSKTLSLQIQPLQMRTGNARGNILYAMGSAGATLTWNGRHIPGRVIYEYLVMRDSNRLARTQWSMFFKSFAFNGFYLITPDSKDVYAQAVRGGMGDMMGSFAFSAGDKESAVSENLHVDVTDRTQGPGFFRWPQKWEGSWSSSGHTHQLKLTETSHKTAKSWLTGGFSMGFVEGTYTQDGVSSDVVGFSEVIQ